MIVFILLGGSAVLLAAFALMPDFPATPQSVIDTGNTVITFVMDVVQIFRYVLSPLLFWAGLVVILAIFAVEPVYHGIMWVLKKIPILGIK